MEQSDIEPGQNALVTVAAVPVNRVLPPKITPRMARKMAEEKVEAMKEHAQQKWDEAQGYDMPDPESFTREESFTNACLGVLERRVRRLAREEAKGASSEQESVVQNGAEWCTLPGGVDHRQQQVILGLLAGKPAAAIAYELGVHRNTIHRWRSEPVFQRSLHHARKIAWDDGLEMTRSVVLQSVMEMRKQLKSRDSQDTRFRAAQAMIYMVGSKQLTPKEMDENAASESEQRPAATG